MKSVLLLLFVFFVAIVSVHSQSTELFISEYAEGSSNNKYFEIYNGTGSDINLGAYSIKRALNGEGWYDTENLSGILPHGSVYVISHPSADQIILNVSDLQSSVAYYNGDDAIGLFKDDVLIDVIGDPNVDPGSGWSVAGVDFGTQNHTIVRKVEVCSPMVDWLISSGTNMLNSEWIVFEMNDWTNLGSHYSICSGEIYPPTVITGDASDFSSGAATLNGIVSANGTNSTVYFEWGLYSGYGNITNAIPYNTNDFFIPVQCNLAGLNNGVEYHFRIVAQNSEGISYGEDNVFIPYDYEMNGEDFDLDLGDWVQFSVSGDQVWEQASFGDLSYVEMSGYEGGYYVNEDWLLSPPIDVLSYSNVWFKFDNARHYSGQMLELLVSIDYDGVSDPNSANWVDISSEAQWSTGSINWVNSGVVDLSSFSGNELYIAFVYHSNSTSASTWEIDNIFISGEQVMSGVPTPLSSEILVVIFFALIFISGVGIVVKK